VPSSQDFDASSGDDEIHTIAAGSMYRDHSIERSAVSLILGYNPAVPAISGNLPVSPFLPPYAANQIPIAPCAKGHSRLGVCLTNNPSKMEQPQQNINHSPDGGVVQRKRRRARVACEPCRERKRKCDGHEPCDTCFQYEYDCFYTSPLAPKKRVGVLYQPEVWKRSTASLGSTPTVRVHRGEPRPHSIYDDNSVSSDPPLPKSALRGHLELLEANSGAAFVRRLGLKIDPSNAPRLHLFAWNTGERLADFKPTLHWPVNNIMKQAELRALAVIYFEKIAHTYGFIDRDNFFERLDARFRNPNTVDEYDPVLCGVAALGSLFSELRPPKAEHQLVESARFVLETQSLLTPPSIDTVTGWVLRVAYLRMTALPHAAWMASCSMMHVVEAANIHLEEASDTVFTGSPDVVSVDIRRRLWALAQHLNIWISFDLGRTRVSLPGASTKPLVPKPGDYTSQLLGLIPLTESLDPGKSRTEEELEADLVRILGVEYEEPPVVMAQTNLMLCIFRRLRTQNSNILSRHEHRVIRLAKKGLQAAHRMVETNSPWHHAANVPFQVVCLFLAIDSRYSLQLLGYAMSTLNEVATAYDTAVMREAYNTAYLLIMLHQRRKASDAGALQDVMNAHNINPAISPANGGPVSAANDQPLQSPSMQPEMSWMEDLIADMPTLRGLDVYQFLYDDPM
jgi:hypothetical protein